MSSRKKPNLGSANPQTKPVVLPVTAVPRGVRTDAGAHDKTPKSDFSIFGDPLWGIAIVSGILFAALAALMAVG